MSEKHEIISKLIEIIDTMIEGTEYILNESKLNLYNMFEELFNIIVISLAAIYKEIASISTDKDLFKNDIVYKNVYNSLYNINRLYKEKKVIKLQSKLEFELIPLLQDMKQDLYYWHNVYPDNDKINYYNNNERVKLSCNKYIDEYELINKYKYDLSIIVLAYNKLEYTKMCMHSLLEHIPKNLNYELILINHGSNDGTKEYFEHINPTKQLDLLANGWGVGCVKRIVEGKFTLAVSNDVLVTKNAIENMIKCIKSDDKIGKIVPTTTNVSNLQTIECNFTNIGEMYDFASINNVSNPFKWEQRTRLCDPISFYSSKIYFSSKGIIPESFYLGSDMNSFPDDKASLVLRRNGYKLILAKDAFCYHFGSITLKDEITEKNEIEFYNQGRKKFYSIFGIDPWGKGFCYSIDLLNNINIKKDGHIEILGINCGLGSNPLKIRECIKEDTHNLDVHILNINDELQYDMDLKSVSDEYIYCVDTSKYLFNINKKFDYIVIEDDIKKYLLLYVSVKQMVDALLNDNGQMNISNNFNNYKLLSNIDYCIKKTNEWLIINKDAI